MALVWFVVMVILQALKKASPIGWLLLIPMLLQDQYDRSVNSLLRACVVALVVGDDNESEELGEYENEI